MKFTETVELNEETLVYLLLREDLSNEQKIVQASHAVANLMLEYGTDPFVRNWAKEHRTLVVLGVKNLEMLNTWINKLEDLEVKSVYFTEPDLNNEATALAVHPKHSKLFAPLFKKLRLIKCQSLSA